MCISVFEIWKLLFEIGEQTSPKYLHSFPHNFLFHYTVPKTIATKPKPKLTISPLTFSMLQQNSSSTSIHYQKFHKRKNAKNKNKNPLSIFYYFLFHIPNFVPRIIYALRKNCTGKFLLDFVFSWENLKGAMYLNSFRWISEWFCGWLRF